MTTIIFSSDGTSVAAGLMDALEKLTGAGSEVELNFSLVSRIDTEALRAIEALALRAESTSGKVVLRGVNAQIYRVLKLTSLAGRFSYQV